MPAHAAVCGLMRLQGAGIFALYTLVNDAGCAASRGSPCGGGTHAEHRQMCTDVRCPEKRLCFLRWRWRS